MPSSRTTNSAPYRGAVHETASRRETARTPDYGILQGAVFELTPVQLRQHWEAMPVEMDEGDSDAPSDEPELLPNIDDETELEDRDPDAIRAEEAIPWQELAISLGRTEDGPSADPLLDLSDVYALRVLPASPDHWLCRFEAPNWMWQAPHRLRPHAARLRRMLRLLAELLEKEKQAFLREPNETTFLEGESDFNSHPIVTQKGMLERLNRQLPEEERYGEDHLSRLLKYDKVWMLWPVACMPLAALFDKSFKLPWAVRGCLDLQDREIWRQTEVSLPSRADMARAVSVRDQSLKERLASVAFRTGLGAEEILKAVRGEGGT